MDRNELIALADKILSKQASLEEIARYNNWYNSLQNNNEGTVEGEDLKKAALFARIQEEIQLQKVPVLPRIYRYAAAAAIILGISTSGYFLIRKAPVQHFVQTQSHDIAPGGNKAILTLGNGKKVDLTTAKNGTLALQGLVAINKTQNGQVTYSSADKQNGEIAYNTITTPRGGQYHLVLADGTNVWLNAASSLKYPVAFRGNNRKVELTGEGYFEVAKDRAHPFIVKTTQQEVKVLGTHFNINAYNDEPSVKTTLLEGSVKVTATMGVKTIAPGQQAVLSNTGITAVEANTEEAVAWKNGDFDFNSEKIESIMKKLSRWYNIGVTYQGNVQSKSFTGKISRFKNISQVLKMLSETNSVHFKIKERRVIVTE